MKRKKKKKNLAPNLLLANLRVGVTIYPPIKKLYSPVNVKLYVNLRGSGSGKHRGGMRWGGGGLMSIMNVYVGWPI